ncbi:hypothetical protein [Pectinatus sottacetonis]|uniref:hypothetical protein n=1 Tax=Pectinatus sottacetonis TaxID=1002795 RepID=UPI0018C58C3D|nr:hypothetical protein [Pectinatus sottacetonis]
MKKLLLILSVMLIIPLNVHAEIRQTESGNTITRESAFTYTVPISDNKSYNKNIKSENIFSSFVKITQFYNRDKTHFRSLCELELTSRTKKIDLLFNKNYPPKIEYTSNGQLKNLILKDVYYNDQYFISFKLKKNTLMPLYTADKVEIVFPVITNGCNFIYKKNKKGNLQKLYQKNVLTDTSTVIEKRYIIPSQIIREWQNVMTTHLTPGSIASTL